MLLAVLFFSGKKGFIVSQNCLFSVTSFILRLLRWSFWGCLCFSSPGPMLRPQPWPWLPALAPNFYLPALTPNLYFLNLVPNLYLPSLALNLHLPALATNLNLQALVPTLCFPALAPNVYLSTLAPTLCLPEICIYQLSWGPEFAYTQAVKLIYPQ